MRGVSRGAPGGPVAAARSAVRRVGVLAHRLRPKMRAFELATQAVEHARASGDASLLARALSSYANVAVVPHRLDDAERALARSRSDPEGSRLTFALRCSKRVHA